MYKTVLMVVFFIHCFFIPSSVLAEPASHSVDMLKQVLLSKEEQVQSFVASYTLSQKGFGENEGLTWKKDQKHNLKFKEDVYNWTRERYLKPGLVKTTYSNYDGVFVSFQTGDYAPNNKGAAGIVGRKKNPVPASAFLDPRMVTFGYMDRKTLKDSFKNSEFFTWKSEEGYDVLSRVNLENSKRYDYFLDEDFKLVRIKYGNSPTKEYISEHRNFYAGLDRKDIFDVMREIELSNFVNIDGVDIPTKAVEKKKLTKKPSKENMTQEEIAKYVFDENNKEVYVVQTMVVDKDSIEVNPELGEAELKIKFPPGTTVVDKLLGIDFVVGESSEDYLKKAIGDSKYIWKHLNSVNSESSGNLDALSVSKTNGPAAPKTVATSQLTKVKRSHNWSLWILGGILVFMVCAFLMAKKVKSNG